METVKIYAKLLLYVARILTLLYLATFLYAMFVLVAKTSALQLRNGDKNFELFFPFTKTPFLLGFYNLTYISMEFLPVFILYALFFFLLSKVFHVFTQNRLFTAGGYDTLRLFYIGNFTIPVLMLILNEVFSEAGFDGYAVTGLHIVLAIFTYFMAAIFKQGLRIQNDQDLII